jgi:AcrR family transcriptional regulator
MPKQTADAAARSERTQRERSDATTKALVDAARELFARDGYEGTFLDDVARAAGVTKGALYHHFEGKRELFRAVFEAEERRLMRMVAAASAKQSDPWRGFYDGCRAYLEACVDPSVQRITLIDAPAVLGGETVREIEERYAMSLVRNGLRMAIDAGVIARRPVEPLASMLNGALCEAALMIARADDPATVTRQVQSEVKTLLDSLRVTKRTARRP